MTPYRLAPSILAADFNELGRDIRAIEEAGCHSIHFDVMDGLFVPSISFGFPVLEAVKKVAKTPLDVHLMIQEPIRYIDRFVKSGADSLTIHVEACQNTDEVHETIRLIHSLGAKAGISINPETPAEAVYPFLYEVDLILIMTVHPGFGGQSYIHECTEKIADIRQMLDQEGLSDEVELQVDGGIGPKTLGEAMDAGASYFVAGSSVFRGDVAENVAYFLKEFQNR